MPRFLIERQFATQLELDREGAARITRINDQEGVKWLFSFLSADKTKTYCLYDAPSAEAIRSAARRAGLPADTIVELDSETGPEIGPEMFAAESRPVARASSS